MDCDQSDDGRESMEDSTVPLVLHIVATTETTEGNLATYIGQLTQNMITAE
jgi:hypothetical protein